MFFISSPMLEFVFRFEILLCAFFSFRLSRKPPDKMTAGLFKLVKMHTIRKGQCTMIPSEVPALCDLFTRAFVHLV